MRDSICGQSTRETAAIACKGHSTARCAVKHTLRHAKACYYRGDALMDMKRYDEAIIALENAVKLVPRFIAPHYSLVSAHLALGHYDEAMSTCIRLMHLETDHSHALRMLTAINEIRTQQEAIDTAPNAEECQPYCQAVADVPQRVCVLN